jgi:hypothetical protein
VHASLIAEVTCGCNLPVESYLLRVIPEDYRELIKRRAKPNWAVKRKNRTSEVFWKTIGGAFVDKTRARSIAPFVMTPRKKSEDYHSIRRSAEGDELIAEGGEVIDGAEPARIEGKTRERMASSDELVPSLKVSWPFRR